MAVTDRAGQRSPQPPAVAARPAPQWALLPLRLFLGVTFSFAGLQKLANPSYLDASSPLSVQAQMLSLRHQSPIGWLLGLSAHAPVLVGVLIALGELAVGLATLVGLWVRLAAAGGALLSLTFFLTVSFHTQPYYYGSDIVFLFAWTAPLIAGWWPGWTADGVIRDRARRDSDPQRRALVLGLAAAGALAAFTGVAAAVTAATGRALHRSPRSRADAVSPSAPTASATPAGAASTESTPAAAHTALPGRHIVAASAVPVGRSFRFTAPDGSPAWLVNTRSRGFRAFSAVCTHAGCTVGLSGNTFVCPCHGGEYDATTGAVVAGPPPSPLRQYDVRVVDGDVRLI